MAVQGSGGMILTWKPDYEENLPHFRFSHHIFHVNCPGITIIAMAIASSSMRRVEHVAGVGSVRNR
jgi:hypothetical protein